MRALERTLWSIGIVLVGVCLGVLADQAIGKRRALADFDAERAARLSREPESPLPASDAADTRLWSAKRIEAYQASAGSPPGAAIAVLRIPKIGLTVPVLDGTDELSLNRGVGRIEETARPGESGNLGIAGHRDGFFRGLKDVAVGDEVDLVTLDATRGYRVASISIVDPEDVSVLAPTPDPVLTLVSCYPFYFVGEAPKRYVVRARLN